VGNASSVGAISGKKYKSGGVIRSWPKKVEEVIMFEVRKRESQTADNWNLRRSNDRRRWNECAVESEKVGGCFFVTQRFDANDPFKAGGFGSRTNL